MTRKELATKRYGLRRSALLAAGVDEQTRELALGSATSAQV
jgi:hypothetical protein